MKIEPLRSIEIGEDGRLHLVTTEEKFTMIYRSATEVHWDPQMHSLYSPKPKDWSYLQWFNHIVKTISNECQIKLQVTNETCWRNIPDGLKSAILASD